MEGERNCDKVVIKAGLTQRQNVAFVKCGPGVRISPQANQYFGLRRAQVVAGPRPAARRNGFHRRMEIEPDRESSPPLASWPGNPAGFVPGNATLKILPWTSQYIFTQSDTQSGLTMRTKDTIYVGKASGLPRRIVNASASGNVDGITDFYDYGAHIVITLPPCK